MKVIIDVDEKRYKDIQRIAEVQLDRRTDTVEQLIAKGTPLDDLIAELGRCKTWHEMQLSERDTKGKLMISDIFSHIIAIIDGYTTDKAESEE